MTASARLPSRSILTSPVASTPCMSYCVTTRPLAERSSGRLVGQRAVADDDAAGVDREVAGQAVEGRGGAQHRAPGRSVEGEIGELGREPGGCRPLVLAAPREVAGHAVDLGGRHAERLGGLAHGAARLEGDVRGDHGHAFLAVDVVGVLDDRVATPPVDVEVDVGTVLPGRGEEALEGQVVAQRVDGGDAERVGDDRVRRRPAADDGDRLRAREEHEAVDDQEVVAEAAIPDDAQLAFEPGEHVGTQLPVAPLEALDAERRQPAVGGVLAFVQTERGQAGPCGSLETELEALGDPDGVRGGLGVSSKAAAASAGETSQARRGARSSGRAVAAEGAGHDLAEELQVPDGEQQAVEVVLLRAGEEDAEGARERPSERVRPLPEGAPPDHRRVGDDLGVEVALVEGGVERGEQPRRGREHDEAGAELGEVVLEGEALVELAAREQAAEGAVAGRVLHEHDGPVVSPGVVDLGAVERPDAHRVAESLEGRQGVGAVGVGQGERGVAVRGGPRDEHLGQAGPGLQRERRVHVEVDERGGRHGGETVTGRCRREGVDPGGRSRAVSRWRGRRGWIVEKERRRTQGVVIGGGPGVGSLEGEGRGRVEGGRDGRKPEVEAGGRVGDGGGNTPRRAER